MDVEAPAAEKSNSKQQIQFRKIPVPPRRFTPLKKAWIEIYTPIYEEMKIDIRMNLKGRRVELKIRSDTPDASNLHKCGDFVHAFMLGFDVVDAKCMLWNWMDEMRVETFEIQNAKLLRGEKTSQAIGRRIRKGLMAKYAIANSTRTRIITDHSKIHILGSFANIQHAANLFEVYFNFGATKGNTSDR